MRGYVFIWPYSNCAFLVWYSSLREARVDLFLFTLSFTYVHVFLAVPLFTQFDTFYLASNLFMYLFQLN